MHIAASQACTELYRQPTDYFGPLHHWRDPPSRIRKTNAKWSEVSVSLKPGGHYRKGTGQRHADKENTRRWTHRHDPFGSDFQQTVVTGVQH